MSEIPGKFSALFYGPGTRKRILFSGHAPASPLVVTLQCGKAAIDRGRGHMTGRHPRHERTRFALTRFVFGEPVFRKKGLPRRQIPAIGPYRGVRETPYIPKVFQPIMRLCTQTILPYTGKSGR
jgi:hypothetical protein